MEYLQIMGYSDTDVAEYLYTSKPDIKSLVNYLCKDLSKACSTKPPPVLKVMAFPVWKLNIFFQSIMYASLKTMTWQSQRFCLSSYLMIFSVFKLRWNLVLVQSSLVFYTKLQIWICWISEYTWMIKSESCVCSFSLVSQKYECQGLWKWGFW